MRHGRSWNQQAAGVLAVGVAVAAGRGHGDGGAALPAGDGAGDGARHVADDGGDVGGIAGLRRALRSASGAWLPVDLPRFCGQFMAVTSSPKLSTETG